MGKKLLLTFVFVVFFALILTTSTGEWNWLIKVDLPILPTSSVTPLCVICIGWTMLMAFNTNPESLFERVMTSIEIGCYLIVLLLHWWQIEVSSEFVFPVLLAQILFWIVVGFNLIQFVQNDMPGIPAKIGYSRQ
jgi:hypothetical protein